MACFAKHCKNLKKLVPPESSIKFYSVKVKKVDENKSSSSISEANSSSLDETSFTSIKEPSCSYRSLDQSTLSTTNSNTMDMSSPSESTSANIVSTKKRRTLLPVERDTELTPLRRRSSILTSASANLVETTNNENKRSKKAMDIGTPSTSNANKRRSLLQSVIESSELRRSFISASTISSETTPRSNNDVNKRSYLTDIQKRISITDTMKFLSEADMKSHMEICTKLFNENKINAKNAWHLHIIDLLKDLAQDSSPDALQLACNSLDICAKVYGVRVDDLHSEVMKLADTLARATEHIEDQDEPQVGDKSVAEGQQPKQKKKKSLRGNKRTICKDPKSFKAPLPKLEPAVFSTKTNFGASAFDNMFTNTMKMDKSGCNFMLLSKELYWTNHPDSVLKDHDKHDRKKYPLRVIPFDVKLCIPFRDFSVNNWKPREDEKQMASEKSVLEEVVYDDDGIPIHELDGPIRDIFEDNGNDEAAGVDGDDEVVGADIVPRLHQEELPYTVSFAPNETNYHLPRSEYSYNTLVKLPCGKYVDQIWAGPSHWKFKHIRSAPVRYSGQDVENVKKQKHTKKKKEEKYIDFLYEIPEARLTTKLSVKKRKPHILPLHKVIMPIQDKSGEEFISAIYDVMSRPGELCPRRKKPEDEKQVKNTDNPTNPQCSQNGGQDNDDNGLLNASGPIDNDPADDYPNEDNDGPMDAAGSIDKHQGQGENVAGCISLIASPVTVPTTSYVPYARKPKRMDMKKLKAALWQVLTGIMVDKDILVNRPGVVEPTAFSKMYSALPSVLSEGMKKNLSCQLTFVALLDLANEQGLMMKQQGNDDFNIFGPGQMA